MMHKVLVCDDEQDILEITSMILQDEGYEVCSVADSREVVSLIEQELPGLLLIDLWMPHISGDAIVRNIRSNGKLKHIPIIVFSASREGKRIALAAGADDFMEKPFDMDKMLSTVEKHFSANWSQRQSF